MDGTISAPGTIAGTLSAIGSLNGALSSAANISGELVIPTYVDVDIYDGEYVVSPDEAEKTLQTANKTMTQNVIINPIPENYGRLLWSGKTLTVY